MKESSILQRLPWLLFSSAFVLFTAAFTVFSQTTEIVAASNVVEISPAKGFDYPYFLYSPPELRPAFQTILVMPNNTGTADDDYEIHKARARKDVDGLKNIANKLKVVLLIPAFPRPKAKWQIYTHALDRDSMITDDPKLKRFDLQLEAMIDDARRSLRGTRGLKVDSRVLMMGFSAAGMFTNRFTFLHPDRVKAAAFGSPGGWAIAPLEKWQGKKLRYPIGVADIAKISGRPLNIQKLKKIPLFLFMGDEDTNDSVIYRDSYDDEDETLIFSVFGKTPLERWPVNESIYLKNLDRAQVKLYPKAGHNWTKDMWKDLYAFFGNALGDAK